MTMVKPDAMRDMTPSLQLALGYLKAVLAGWPEQSETPFRCGATMLACVCDKSEEAHLTATAQMMCAADKLACDITGRYPVIACQRRHSQSIACEASCM